jgi:hypothetical protein
MPNCAIFADTGNEKQATYRHLDWLETVLPYPIVRVRRFPSDLATETVAHYRAEGGSKYTPPFFYAGGMLPIHCSKEWKTRAVIREVRRQLGYAPGERGRDQVEVWIGISTDEAQRMKSAEPPWMHNRWPLIEQRLRRGECLLWLSRHDYKLPPRSACTHCPLQSDREFAEMATEDFAAACAFDEAIRQGGNGTDGPLYLSRHLRPLAKIDFAKLSGAEQPDLFGNDCTGVCGV